MNDLWRGSLLPLGCEAAPNVPGPNRVVWIYDCFAAEREQAPSPQKPLTQRRLLLPNNESPPANGAYV